MASPYSSPLLKGSLVSRLNFTNVAAAGHATHEPSHGHFGTLSPAVASVSHHNPATQPIVQLPDVPRLPQSSANKITQLIQRYKELRDKNKRLKELCKEQRSNIDLLQRQNNEHARECRDLEKDRDSISDKLAMAMEDIVKVEAAREAAEHRASAVMDLIEARKQRISSTPVKYRVSRSRTGNGSSSPSAKHADDEIIVAAASVSNRANDSGEEKKSSVMGRGASMIGSLLSSVSGESSEVKKLRQELEVVLDELGRKIQENEDLHVQLFELKRRQHEQQQYWEKARQGNDAAYQALSQELEVQKQRLNDQLSELASVKSEKDSIANVLAAATDSHTKEMKRVMNAAARAINETAVLRRAMAKRNNFQVLSSSFRCQNDGSAGGITYNEEEHRERVSTLCAFLVHLKGWLSCWCEVVSASLAWVRTQIAFPKLTFVQSEKDAGVGSPQADHEQALRALVERLSSLETDLTHCVTVTQTCAEKLQLQTSNFGNRAAEVARNVAALLGSLSGLRKQWALFLPDCLNLLSLSCIEVHAAPSPDDGDLRELHRRFAEHAGHLGDRLKRVEHWASEFTGLFQSLTEHEHSRETVFGGSKHDVSVAAQPGVVQFVELFTAWHVGGFPTDQALRQQQWMLLLEKLRATAGEVVEASELAVELISSHPSQDAAVQRSGRGVQNALQAVRSHSQPLFSSLQQLYEICGRVAEPLLHKCRDSEPRNFEQPIMIGSDVSIDSLAAYSNFGSPMPLMDGTSVATFPNSPSSSKQIKGEVLPPGEGESQQQSPAGVRTPTKQNKTLTPSAKREQDTIGIHCRDRVAGEGYLQTNLQHTRCANLVERINMCLHSDAGEDCLNEHGHGDDICKDQDDESATTVPIDTSSVGVEHDVAAGTLSVPPSSTVDESHGRPTMAPLETVSVGVGTNNESVVVDNNEVLSLKAELQELTRQLVRCLGYHSTARPPRCCLRIRTCSNVL